MINRDIVRSYSGAIYINDINEAHKVPVKISGLTSVSKVPMLSILIWDTNNSAYKVALISDVIDNDTDFVILMEDINLTSGEFIGNVIAFTKAAFDKNKVKFLDNTTNTFVFSPSSITSYKHPRFKIVE
ncbi:MAG: hypothetical protein ACPL1F_00060 [bacterium]